MFLGSFRRLLVLSIVSLPLTLGVTGCGGNTNEPKLANVKPGPMPEGHEWQGVYYSQHYGELHLEADGDSANGTWKTPMGSFGELYGKIEGNLLRYEWKERRIGAVGADATKSGKGYFVYLVPREGEAPEIHGEWGLGQSDAGNTWEAVKQKNKQPDLKSQRPDEFEGQVSGGGWDDEGQSPPSDSGSSDGSAPLE
jgi:hypothetical protein